jgi:hypothetical protein
LVALQAPVFAYGKPATKPETKHAESSHQDSSTTATPAATPSTDQPTTSTATSATNDHPQPHITVATPPPLAAPAPWQIQDKISWGANLILVVLAYWFFMKAKETLQHIEHQSQTAENTAQAALEAARAASKAAQSAVESSESITAIAKASSLNAQAVINAERPWILMTIEPSRETKNHFRIMAINRGRTPAAILASSDRIGLAIDETYLPKTPEYATQESSALPVPIILLPGESTIIQPFGREDVKWVCKSQERLRQIELWQEKIFIYGRVIYKDLISTEEKQMHVTDWCCKYIHGESSSDLVMAGPAEYNKHT